MEDTSNINFIIDPNIWISVIAILISIVALFQTNRQIKLGNRQQLFDRRLDKYLFVRDLLNLYNKNQNLCVEYDDKFENVDFLFAMLTNCAALESICTAISEPLHGDKHKEFLTKCEMFEKSATEIELLWTDDLAKITGQFVRAYKDLLMALYQQQIMLNHIKKLNEETPITLEVFQNKAKENAERIKLFEIIDKIDCAYREIVEKKIEEHLKKSIKL